MPAATRTGARAALLAGPVVLAFFSGGYFDEPRAWAGAIAWLLALVAILSTPWPRSRGSRLAIGGLAGLAVWTLLSILWAPVAGSAYHQGQLIVLYLGGLVAAAMLLRARRAAALVEPAVLAGVLIVVGYGISERLLPGLLHFSRSISAEGRLEQPLTYWNAMGELAAIGLVLALRLAGARTRPRWLRLAATAAASPLGLGLFVSFSRGALFACAAGIVTLIVVAPERAQLRSGAVALGLAVVSAAAAAPLRGVTALEGSGGTIEHQGLIALGLLLVLSAIALAVQWRLTLKSDPRPLQLPRRASTIALLIICLGLGLAIIAGAKESSKRPLSGGATRLITLQSNRYAYWRVAMRAFADQPLHGVGAGGWAVYWLRLRPIDEFAQDAHSLPLQTLAELGLVGGALLLAFLAGITLAALRALRQQATLAAGPVAGLVSYIAHAPLDWDWQMPALTLLALLLAGTVLALSEHAVVAPQPAPEAAE